MNIKKFDVILNLSLLIKKYSIKKLLTILHNKNID